jgi:peptide/nickel transport system substrate-binding protein
MRTRWASLRFGVLAALAVLAVAVIAAGCGGGTSNASAGGSSGSSENEGKAQPGGTLRIADTAEPISLNPTTVDDNPSIHAVTQIVEPLFKANMEGEIEPWLAESAKPSADHKTWTVTLRKGVDFSNGKPMTAADVVFSLETVRKSALWGSMFEAIKSVRETSPDTVVITTSTPAAKLEGQLSLPFAGIVPNHFGGMSEKEFGNNPIGTGPFMLASWKRGETLTLEKNPHYWRKGEPLLDKVVFSVVPDVDSRTTQLRSGELDAIASPDWSQLASLESDSSLHVGTYAMGYLDALGLNLKNPLFQDPRVREAINLAIDREGIVSAALDGHGEPAGSWLTPALEDHDPSIKAPTQDIAKAKELVAEAVKEKGLTPTLTLSLITGDNFSNTASQIIQQNLEEIGLKVALQPLDESALISQLEAGKYDAYFLYLSSDIVDPSELASYYPATDAQFTSGKTAEVEKLAAQANAATNEGERRQLYYKMQEVVNKEKAFVTVDYRPFVWAMQSNVVGFDVNATGVPWLAEAGFTK